MFYLILVTMMVTGVLSLEFPLLESLITTCVDLSKMLSLSEPQFHLL